MRYVLMHNDPPFHRLAFPKRRGKRRAHTKCGIAVGAGDTIVRRETIIGGLYCANCVKSLIRMEKRAR